MLSLSPEVMEDKRTRVSFDNLYQTHDLKNMILFKTNEKTN